MKSFKQFVREQQNQEQAVEQGLIDKSGVPNAVVLSPSDEERQLMQQKQQSNLEEDQGVGKNFKPVSDKSFLDWSTKNHNEHLGKSNANVQTNLSDTSNISEDEGKHLYRYTRSSTPLNTHLYEGHHEGWDAPAHYFANQAGTHSIKHLDNAVSKPLDHDLHVHTGVAFHPGELAAKHPEGHVHLPAYTSTSLHPLTAHSFAKHMGDDKHVLNIHLKPGDKGRYVGTVSHYEGEMEYTLPRKTTLKIHPTPDVHTDGEGKKVHVWHATVHSQE